MFRAPSSNAIQVVYIYGILKGLWLSLPGLVHSGKFICLGNARGAYLHEREVFFAIKYFSKWTVAFEVYYRLFVDNLGFMAVDRIKKHLLVLGLFCP